ncbi:MAG: hydrogenase expression/formation protein HypE [Candidatus Alcyoniella australis]|nr:hydrogenase expression/formation protein HypE [Candidatus Alcyoniella australis]
MTDNIRLAHGFGGRLTQELLDELILPALSGREGHAITLDAALIEDIETPLAFSTDSFTISPIFFPGGDIGKLAVCGTLNDVAMIGARPRYLSLSLLIEEGLPLDDLRRVMASIGDTCRGQGVEVVTGDTKVLERGALDKLFINTTGIGPRLTGPLGPAQVREGDAILISGTIGDHGAAILNEREQMGFRGELKSDCAPLWPIVQAAHEAAADKLHALRDPTRGGLAATLNEFATDTGLQYVIQEQNLPIRDDVAAFLEVLGLDPLPLANEGKCLLFVDPSAAGDVLDAVRSAPYGENATQIGHVEPAKRRGRVVLQTAIGTRRVIEMPLEAGLPRIC